MALTLDEVAKIEEEEKVRAQPRARFDVFSAPATKQNKSHPILKFFIIVGIILIALITISSIYSGIANMSKDSYKDTSVSTNDNELSSQSDKQLLQSVVQLTDVRISKVSYISITPYVNYGENARQITVNFNVSREGTIINWMSAADVMTGMMFQHIFPLSDNIQSVKINTSVALNDSYGNPVNNDLTTVIMDRKTYQQINWDGFMAGNLRKILDMTGKDAENAYSFSQFANQSMRNYNR